jgi:hypothetical protein
MGREILGVRRTGVLAVGYPFSSRAIALPDCFLLAPLPAEQNRTLANIRRREQEENCRISEMRAPGPLRDFRLSSLSLESILRPKGPSSCAEDLP